MLSTSRAAPDGRVTATGRRWRLASPATAVALGVVALLAEAAQLVLEGLSHQLPTASADIANTGAGVAFVLTFAAVGVVVARSQPRNPMGWLLIAVPLAIQAGNDGSQYAYLDYTLHHGTLPLGPLALLLTPSWQYCFVLVPLVVLLFPDGRPGRRWRWPLRAYLALAVVFIAATLALAVADLRLRVPVDGSGNLIGLNKPGANAWFAPFFYAGFLSCFVLSVATVLHQALRYRRATGERRQQLKWLGAGGLICVAFFLTTVLWSNAPAIFGDLFFPLALTALPVTIGVGILRYRLYEIDRLISRTPVLRDPHRAAGRRVRRPDRAEHRHARVLEPRRCRRLDADRCGAVQPAAQAHPAPGGPPLQPRAL